MAKQWNCRALARMLTVGLFFGLTGCGGGGGGGGGANEGGSGPGSLPAPGPGPVSGADYFPLAVGDRWSYLGAGARSSARVTGTRIAGGTEVFVMRFDEPGESSEEQYVKSAAGVYMVPQDTADAFDRALAAVPVLKLPIVAGETFVPLDRTLANYADFDGDGRQESIALYATVTVVGFETVTTPAGTWSNVAHTRTVFRQTVTLTTTNQPFVVTLTSDDWYAPDVGPVRNVTTTTGIGSSGTESNIQAWRVGTRRSESVAPTVTSRTPADASLATTAAVRVRFSEAMDRAPVAAHGFVLHGPDGQPVAGSVVWADDTTFDFVPAQTLASGRYEAKLGTGAEDLAGNALVATPLWSFTVDALGPTVLSTVPAADAVEVALDSALRITFDEDVDPATVVAANFSLASTAFNATAIPLSVALEGRTVVLTPSRPLERAARYQLVVGGGIKDRLGNAAPGYWLRFQADPGRFAAPRHPTDLGFNVYGQVLADFNGDGRTDMAVIADSVSNTGQRRLRLLLQGADGTLGPASVVDTGAGCVPDRIHPADLDSDGRADLVVSGGDCGLLTLRQNAGGGFSRTVVSSGYADIKAVVPIAADGGRPALIVQSIQGLELRLLIWRQLAPGAFGPPQPLPGAMNNTNNAAVADFDANGLMDVAFTGLLASNNGSGIAVLYQQADGSLGTLREWRSTLARPPTYSAAGDVTGDGRPDLVFSTDGNSPTFIGVVPQQADGSFGPAVALTTLDLPTQIHVADVTGDGRADVVVGHRGFSAVGVYEQAADGLRPEQTFEAPYGCLGDGSLATGDVNGDGRVDIGYCGSVLLQRARPGTAASATPGGPRAQRLREAVPTAGR